MDQDSSYMVSPGDPCFSRSEAKKLAGQIGKLGYNVEVRGVWIHYTHLRHTVDQGTVKVSTGHSRDSFFPGRMEVC